MRIAVFSDVHGNLPALNSVLRDIEQQGVAAVVCLGDLAYKGPLPGECVQLVRSLGIPCVYGNTDLALLSVTHVNARPSLPESRPVHPAEVPYLQWHVGHLSEADMAYLAALPFAHEIAADGIRVQFVHASPQDCNTAITPSQVEGLAADWLVVGHTHQPCVVKCAGKLLINVGAVGFSLDGDWRPSYAVLDTHEGTVSLRRVGYAVADVVAVARERAFCFDPDWYAQALRTGWWEPVPWEQRAVIDHFPRKGVER
jgi:putative phosphoesterase